MTRVKVCGITSLEDALIAVRAGADALGFVFAASPRQTSPETVREIVRNIPPFVNTVGVFVDESPARVREIMEFCGLDLIQFHGRESPETCAAFMPRSIRAFRVRDPSVLSGIQAYRGTVRAILLDAYSSERHGGTGQSFDWDIAVRARGIGIPMILSGGLNPSNVGPAVSRTAPFAVDVNSGVEQRPGKKAPALLEQFMREIQREVTR